jgi:hypothetical protein
MIRTIGDGGINWNWYLCGDFDATNKTVHIYYYDRWHKYEDRGSNHPRAEWPKNGRLEIMEGEHRIAYGVKLEGIEYLVTNPAYIFSYRDMSVYVPDKD